jgi:hypothetical protein
MTKRILKSGLVLAVFGVLSVEAQINYGDFAGDDVTYIQVTEDSNSDPGLLPLYGAPTISGNTLDFDPNGFGASASGAGGVDITDGNLTMDIHAQPGSIIDTLKFCEAGDFTLAGLGTDGTLVDITATFFVEIFEVDGLGVDPIKSTNTMTFSPNADGTFALGTDGGGGPLYQGIWDGCVEVDLLGLLDDNNYDYLFGATKASVNLDNTLVALSENGTSAFIAKKDFSGFSITTIPEPNSIFLMSISVIGIVTIKRRLSM